MGSCGKQTDLIYVFQRYIGCCVENRCCGWQQGWEMSGGCWVSPHEDWWWLDLSGRKGRDMNGFTMHFGGTANKIFWWIEHRIREKEKNWVLNWVDDVAIEWNWKTVEGEDYFMMLAKRNCGHTEVPFRYPKGCLEVRLTLVTVFSLEY